MSDPGERLESAYYDYMGYDTEHTRDGLLHYLPFFAGLDAPGPVLELACGRGEMLTLLQEQGVAAEGVDIDDGMVEAARAAGLTVALGDALEDLRGRPDDSLAGVFSAHFVEHLTADVVEDLVVQSARALAPGGVFVAVTPNTGCVSVMGYDFWRDPTHVRPYEPHLLAFFCAKAGLEVLEVGANPRNHGGPPPEALPSPAHVDADLRGDIVQAVQRVTYDKRKGQSDVTSPWYVMAHFLTTLEERLRATQEELVALRRSYAHLLDRLYPPNEVYVVARAV